MFGVYDFRDAPMVARAYFEKLEDAQAHGAQRFGAHAWVRPAPDVARVEELRAKADSLDEARDEVAEHQREISQLSADHAAERVRNDDLRAEVSRLQRMIDNGHPVLAGVRR